MRMELTDRSVDLIVTRSGLLSAMVDGVSLVALLLLAGLKVSLVIVAAVIVLTAPIYWLQQRRPAGPKTFAPGRPQAI